MTHNILKLHRACCTESGLWNERNNHTGEQESRLIDLFAPIDEHQQPSLNVTH